MIAGQRKAYDFKSVGQKKTDFDARKELFTQNNPIGIKTPVQLSDGANDLFVMHTNLLNQLKDNFRNLLQTNHGERVGLYDFGCNLGPLVFELGTETVDIEAMTRIKTATAKYMPFVSLKSFVPYSEDPRDDFARRIVRIVYDVPSLGVVDQAIEVAFTIAG